MTYNDSVEVTIEMYLVITLVIDYLAEETALIQAQITRLSTVFNNTISHFRLAAVCSFYALFSLFSRELFLRILLF